MLVSIYAIADTLLATSDTAAARPIVLGNFMGAPLLPARGTAARRNSFNHLLRQPHVLGRPSGPQDRT